MKFLILFFIITNLMAVDSRPVFEGKLNAIKELRIAAEKCGISQPNMALFKKKLKTDLDQIKLDCLLSKRSEIDAELLVNKNKLKKIKSSESFIKTYDCSQLFKDIEKAMCILIKGKL